MGIVHLKGSMLAEYLGGRVDNASIRRHVEGCDLCKARLREERLLRALLGPGGAGAPGAHVDDETLAAYCDQRLEPSRMRTIDRHLAQCDRCLADYLELKQLVETPARAPVPADLPDRAVEWLGSRTLGTLYISVHGSRVLAFFMAEAEHDPSLSLTSTDRPVRGSIGFTQLMDPSESDYVKASVPGAGKKPARASMDFGWSNDTGRIAAGGSKTPDPVVIEVDGSLSLEVAATGPMLDIRAIDPASGEPRAGVVVRFEYGEGQAYVQETDEKGRAAGKLPPADVPARLVLPGPPPRAIDIQLS